MATIPYTKELRINSWDETESFDFDSFFDESYVWFHRSRNSPNFGNSSRLDFLASALFRINTYDSAIDAEFVIIAIEVSIAINNGTTIEYISRSNDHYKWYLAMTHFDFFEKNINWGSSVRHAHWYSNYEGHIIESCDFWHKGMQIVKLTIDDERWPDFINAMVRFASKTVQPE